MSSPPQLSTADSTTSSPIRRPPPSRLTPTPSPKRVEADGLILVDDVALIIEVKSVALTAEARGGIARRLRGKLRDIVTAAANQAGRLRERIITDGRTRLDDGEAIDVSEVREIHTIAVGMEDLSGVTTATTTLIEAGVLREDNIPWTVSVHDLRAVSEVVERPSELLLYLRRRTHPKATWKYRAVDELDLFLSFLHLGLYVEPDPDEVARTLPWSGPPSVEDVHRFAAQQPELVSDHTGMLDAWYASRLDPNARQPASHGSSQIRCFSVLSTRSRMPLRRVSFPRRPRYWKVTDRSSRLSVSTPEISANSYEVIDCKRSTRYARSCNLHAFQPHWQKFLRLIYDNRPLGTNADLDAAATGLVPLDEMERAVPKPIRTPRGGR